VPASAVAAEPGDRDLIEQHDGARSAARRKQGNPGLRLVAAYGNRWQSRGHPEWIAKDIPPTGEIEEYEPRISFGELQPLLLVVIDG
jgi:Uncharacterised protein family (UPF0182)